jgi:hypothetical protein
MSNVLELVLKGETIYLEHPSDDEILIKIDSKFNTFVKPKKGTEYEIFEISNIIVEAVANNVLVTENQYNKF